MPGKKVQGMVEAQGTGFDGTLGHHDKVNLQNSFPGSPIYGNDDLPHPASAKPKQFEMSDEGVIAFFRALLDAKDLPFAGSEAISMDYDVNLPSEGNFPLPEDLKSMEKPYRVPNPTNAPKHELYNPEAKGDAPDRFKKKQEHVSFGAGQGSALEFESATARVAKQDFTQIDFQYNSSNTYAR